MPLFMDMHSLDGGVKADDVAKAHMADLQTQDRYGVRYLRYWVDEKNGKVFFATMEPRPTAVCRALLTPRALQQVVADDNYRDPARADVFLRAGVD